MKEAMSLLVTLLNLGLFGKLIALLLAVAVVLWALDPVLSHFST